MALVVSGPLVVATSSGAQQPQVKSFGDLKKCAARIVNGENQPKILELAGAGITRGIDDINMRHLMRFGSKQASDATITASDGTYALAADFFAVHEVQLINSSSEVDSTLEFIPWGQFNVLEQKQDADGKPHYWTARNSFDDETITIYPTPDADAASDFTLRITYYERVQAPTADTDIVDAPKELGEVLCTYGEWYLLNLRQRNDPRAVERKYAEYRDKLKEFIQSVEREPTAGYQWRIHAIYDNDPYDYDDFDPLR